jgi:polysaccharide biosynthesis transport protein
MSNAMIELIGDLRKEYDLIVLDSPPALAISDARIIARIADAVIYCVRWRDTSRSAVTNGLRVLLDSGAHVIGVALTQVDMKAHARSGYSDAYFYSRPYVGYFNN